MSIIRLACALLIFGLSPTMAQSALSDEELQALVAEVFAAHETPALGAAIVGLDGAIHIAVVGERGAGSGVPVEETDLWHIGSNTKAMTATLIARYAEEGLLSLDDPLTDLFPEFEVHAGYDQATLAQLLSHGTGLAANPGLLRMITLRTDGTPMEAQRAGLAANALGQAPEFTPGTGFLYSNLGYISAGSILEARMDQPWEELITEDLFNPLGISHVGFGAPGVTGEYAQPRGHRSGLLGRSIMGVGPAGDNPAAFGPAGTVHISLADWALFAAEHLRGAQGQSTYLSAESFARLHEPLSPEGNYALGWGIVRGEGASGPITALRHAGSNTMWFAMIELWPARGMGILVVSNDGSEEGSGAVIELTERLRAALMTEE